MKIKVLDEKLIQQIAAGEVVESPSSVIKELIENSIDANSTKIFIELENGGKDLIRITDNGSGMDEEDAKLSIIRHATSKIDDVDDLFNIHTLGFRGEALASISSVSKFELITKTSDSMEAYRLYTEGGNKVKFEKIAAQTGTSISVRSLFFNTPARQKHLKLTSTELNKIIDIVTRYATAKPNIHFTIIHNERTILNSPSSESLLNNIVDIYGKGIAKELLSIAYKDENYVIKGYISKPSISRADKNNVSIYVNGRFVKNKIITDALYDSYHTLLHHQRYPFAVLMIEVDPQRLDVNIHPAKTKIKIEQENRLYEILFDVIKSTLKGNSLIPNSDVKLKTTSQSVLDNDDQKPNSYKEEPIKKSNLPKYDIDTDTQVSLNELNKTADDVTFSSGNVEEVNLKKEEENKINIRNKINSNLDIDTSYDELLKKTDDLVIKETDSNNYKYENYKTQNNISDQKEETTETPKESNNTTCHSNHYEAYSHGTDSTEGLEEVDKDLVLNNHIKFSVVGQLYKTYILTETKDGLMIIDQHAAHERVNFEKLMKDFKENGTIKKQVLISPIKLDLNPKDKQLIEDKKETISELGFDIEEFGDNTYLLRSVPVIIGKQQNKDILLNILDELIRFNKAKSFEDIVKNIMATVACKSSIKAGKALTHQHMNNLLKQLFGCDFPSNCPHGRPTIINVSIEELEKRFKRRGF